MNQPLPLRRPVRGRLQTALLAFAAAAALSPACGSARAEDPVPAGAADERGPLELVFVQQAAGMKFDGKTLTLEGVAPTTSVFSGLPVPTVGQMTTAQFVKLWTATQDSFKKDPPNASLTFVADKAARPVTVELVNVSGSGDTLSYSINVLDGTLPESAGAVSIAIDPVFWRPPAGWNGPFLICRTSPYWGSRLCRAGW